MSYLSRFASLQGGGKNVGFDGVTTTEIHEEENYGKVKKYESKIDTLMSEAGELQSQLDLHVLFLGKLKKYYRGYQNC